MFPRLDQKTINHVTAWERKQSSDIQLSLTPPHPPLPGPPDGCKVSLFSPNLWVFQHNFLGDPPPAERRRVDRRERAPPAGLDGKWEARAGAGPLGGVLLGLLGDRVGRGDVRVCTHRPAGATQSGAAGACHGQSDKKGCAAASLLRPLHGRAACLSSRLASHNKSLAQAKLSICRSVMQG